jgi:hypothetical protein
MNITDLGQVISFISHSDTEHNTVRDVVKLPWDISPFEYLRFAQADIEDISKRGIVNALSNAKRSLECQLDSLMLAFEMHGVSKKWNVPKKLEILKKINVIAPRVLAKTNRHRNEMEHEYSCPTHEVVSDFVDVVALFLDATKVHIFDRQCEWTFSNETLAKYDAIFVNLGHERLFVSSGHAGRGAWNAPTAFELEASDRDFCELLGAIIRCVDPTST